MGFLDRLAHAWNAFKQIEEPNTYRAPNYFNLGYSTTQRPDRMYFSKGNERSIITAVYNRIAIDCAAVKIQHVKMDEKDRYSETVDSKLNTCLNLEANKDQTGRAFIQDLIQSMFDEGCVAAVPIDTSVNPSLGSYDIESMRVGKITQWYPDDVQIEVYNDRIGQRQTIMMPKKLVAIIENPLYSIMNAPNSTLQRLIRKLNILDAIDEQSGSGKLDLIIQLPYIVKTETRRQQAEQRRKDIEEQLSGSKYGIAYTDGTEKITQLNRGVDNNILNQITYLTSMLFSQLGITEEVLNGTANESTMNNYLKRTVEPIVAAVVDEFKRKFLTKTARTQKQTIMYFLDPFKLIPISNLAEFGDKFTRNEILSSNEIRQLIGFKPVKDPMADELRNKNINVKDNQKFATTNNSEVVNQITNKNLEEENNQNG